MSVSKSFIPKTHIAYPENTDGHYLEIKKDDGTVFDKNYPYVDKSKKFKRKQRLIRMGLYTIVFPFSYLKMGLKIRGKKNIRKNKKILKQGALSVCNHVHMWDYICIMNAIKPFKSHMLVWNKNVSGESGPLVRLVGGIPIPENDMSATIKYLDDIKHLLDDGGWIHIYPEGSMWEYYRYIRPFKKGIGHLARMSHKPVVPMGISYRKPSWIRKYIFKQPAAFNLCIGEPIYLNESLPKNEQEEDLLIRLHKSVCELAGINEGENPYPQIFNNSKRID